MFFFSLFQNLPRLPHQLIWQQFPIDDYTSNPWFLLPPSVHAKQKHKLAEGLKRANLTGAGCSLWLKSTLTSSNSDSLHHGTDSGWQIRSLTLNDIAYEWVVYAKTVVYLLFNLRDLRLMEACWSSTRSMRESTSTKWKMWWSTKRAAEKSLLPGMSRTQPDRYLTLWCMSCEELSQISFVKNFRVIKKNWIFLHLAPILCI